MSLVATDRGGTHDPAWMRLRTTIRPVAPVGAPVLTVVDAFSGGGILSVGAIEAAAAAGMSCRHVAHIENWAEAARVYRHNHPDALSYDDVTHVAGGDIGAPLTEHEQNFQHHVLRGAGGRIDVLMGGPPCQGHSNLNNHTRRTDPKNALYLRMARLAEILAPRMVIIENVPGVVADHGNIVDVTKQALIGLGYAVSHRVIRAVDLGVAQSRKRFILVAIKGSPALDLDAIVAHPPTPRSILWAISDLEENPQHPTSSRLWTAKKGSAETQRRINYLFQHRLYDLPNSERPDCHRLKAHNYNSVYGRMYPDRPAPTITGGFGTQGQGRFVHPTKPRVMTPREALRCQDVPDWYDIPDSLGIASPDLHQIIGNGAPPAYARAIIGAAITAGILGQPTQALPEPLAVSTAAPASAPVVQPVQVVPSVMPSPVAPHAASQRARLHLLLSLIQEMDANSLDAMAQDPVMNGWITAGVALLERRGQNH